MNIKPDTILNRDEVGPWGFNKGHQYSKSVAMAYGAGSWGLYTEVLLRLAPTSDVMENVIEIAAITHENAMTLPFFNTERIAGEQFYPGTHINTLLETNTKQ